MATIVDLNLLQVSFKEESYLIDEHSNSSEHTENMKLRKFIKMQVSLNLLKFWDQINSVLKI